MWRNVYYDTKKSQMHEKTWDDDGDRVSIVSDFKPFLFTETEEKTKFKSIYDTNLQPHIFESSYARSKFTDTYDGRIFYNLPPEQQYLIAKYKNHKQEDFTKNPIRVFFLDIEAPALNEFPDPRFAKYEIDLMTIYDSLTKKYYMWGRESWDKSGVEKTLEDLNGEDGRLQLIGTKDIQYFHIENEKERLSHMLDFWEENCPDIYTGWNITGYDTPYIVNRLKLVLPKDEYKRLSPFRNISSRDGFDKFGNPQIEFDIRGVNCMDYMDVFKIFTFKAERESWKLDSVASDVLRCGKVEYEHSNLAELAANDWSKYCTYNLVDVGLLVSMDGELEFLETSRETAYEGFSNFTDSLGKVKVISGSIACSALKSGVLVETKKRSESSSFEGGYVKEPKIGLSTNLFSYDVTSLYPSCMISLNTSLETKVGQVLSEYDGGYVVSIYGEKEKMSFDTFKDYMRNNNHSLSRAGIIFDQTKRGVVIDFVKKQFSNKSLYSQKSKECLSEGDGEGSKYWNRKAKITKIFLNSCYGMLSTASSPYYDLDISRSITLTGQGVTKTAIKTLNGLFVEKYGSKGDVVLASDTDSVMVTFDDVTRFYGKEFFENDKLTDFGRKFSDKIGEFLNKAVNKWAKDELFCNNPTFNFGREKASNASLFFAKKQYAYYVIDNEGFTLPENERMKYTGLKVIKSEYSPKLKKMFDELYRNTLSNYIKLGSKGTRQILVETMKRHKEEFFNFDFFSVSKRSSANNLSLYENGGQKTNIKGELRTIEGFKDRYVSGKGCPVQVKSCIFHNRLIVDLGLSGKYQKHSGGTKSMWSYVMENKYGIESIAGNNGIMPEEFGLEIDYEKQWEKMYLVVAKQLFDTVNWIFPNLKHEEAVDFDELFS